MIDSILDALIEALKEDINLKEIKKFNKLEGMLASTETNISVWTPRQRFAEYDNNQDESNVEIHIGITLQDMNAERGEERIRKLAEEIRLLLVSEQETLGGLLDSSFFETWEYASVSADKGLLLHLAEGIWSVKYYSSRIREVQDESADDIYINENIVTE